MPNPNGPTPRVIYVSRNDPDHSRQESATLSAMKRPSSTGQTQMGVLFSPRTTSLPPPTPSDGMPRSAAFKQTMITQGGMKRPGTAGDSSNLPPSSSLPSLLPQQVVRGGSFSPRQGLSPYAEDVKKERELQLLRKRNRELEGDLKKTSHALTKLRQIHQMQSAYGSDGSLRPDGSRSEDSLKRAADAEDEVTRVKQKYEAKLKSQEAMHKQELAEYRGQFRTAEQQAAEQAAKEKEERIELLRRQIGRRMMNQGITRGFQAWHDMWVAKVQAMDKLRQCGNRLRAPEKSLAFTLWSNDWSAVMEARREKERRMKEGGMSAERQTIMEQMEKLKAELAAAEEDKKTSLERLRIELSGTAEEYAAMQAEKAKEERIELLRRQVMRRMMNQGIANGFTAWVELWEAKTYALNRLREVGNRLRSPEIFLAFGFWSDDWRETKRIKELAELEKQASGMEAQLRQLRFENGQMEMMNLAAQDELKTLRERNAELLKETKEKGAQINKLLPIEKEVVELRELQAEADKEAEVAEKKRAEAESDAEKQRVEDKKLLEKLLLEQRKGFEAELERFRMDVEAEAAERERGERVELLRRQITRRIMNRGIAMGFTAWTEMWQAKTYAMQRLRECGNRLKAPELSLAFTFWVRLAQARRENKLAKEGASRMDKVNSQAQRMAQLEGQVKALTQEISTVNSERQALREKVALLDGGVAEAERLREEQAAKEKEERIELLRRQIGRRMMNQGITRGFQGWFEFWESKKYALDKLRQVGNKLRSPELSNAFGMWQEDWHLEIEAKLEAENRSKSAMLLSSGERFAQMETELAQVKKELTKANAERQMLREKVGELDGGVAEAERLREEQAAKEKEERIELLRRQIGRRMMNQGITRGFQAWMEMWEAKRYALEKLREVGNHLRSPEKAAAFNMWSESWDEEVRARELAKLKKAAGSLETVEGRLRSEVEELKQQVTALAEEKRVALERQMIELTGSASQQEALAEQRAKEERIELLRRQMIRRMMNKDINWAFSGWVELWEAKTYGMKRLREVGNRFKSPKVLIAFEHWYDVSYAAKEAAKLARAEENEARLEKERFELDSELMRVKNEYDVKLKNAEEANLKLMERITALGGDAAEADALLEAREAKEREARIELLRRQIGRRMMNRGLTLGWTAWSEMYTARKNALTMMRIVGNRFKTPAMANAFEDWHEDWQEAQVAAERAARNAKRKQLASGLEGTAAALKDELDNLKAEMRQKLEEAEMEKRRELDRQLTELTGSASDIQRLAEEKAKEERIELLRRQMVRRIMNRDIAMGFQAWLEMWEAKRYALDKLRGAGNKLKAPELYTAFSSWADDFYAEQRRLELERIENLGKSLEAQLRQSRHDHTQVSMYKSAIEDELKALKDKLGDLTRDVKERDDRIDGLLEVQKEHEQLKEEHKGTVEVLDMTKVRLEESEADQISQQAADKELLERLLAEQRSSFEEEQAKIKMQTQKYREEKKATDDQIASLSGEVMRVKSEAEKEKAKVLEEVKSLQRDIKERVAKEEAAKKAAEKKKAEAEAKKKKSAGPLGSFDLDEGPGAPPISEQIAMALRKNSARVLDLFRSWDTDGDGEVTRAEFHEAMPKLGLDVPKKEIDTLFSEWDKDGGGALTLRELQKILSAAKVSAAVPKTKAEESLQTATNVAAAAGALAKLGKKGAPSPGKKGAPPAAD